jgi:AcrR family transcriptional regulator
MGRVARRPGRRWDPRLVARRREQILQTAATLFARHGSQALDVQRLADALGLAKGTLDRYFRSKEAVFLAAVDRGMVQLRAHVGAATAGVADPLDRIAATVRAYLAFFRDHPDQAELLLIERVELRDRKKATYLEHREAIADEWRGVYAGLMRAGRVRTMPTDRLIELIGDLLYGTMFTAHFNGGRVPLDEQARELTAFIYRGILTPADQPPAGPPAAGRPPRSPSPINRSRCRTPRPASGRATRRRSATRSGS